MLETRFAFRRAFVVPFAVVASLTIQPFRLAAASDALSTTVSQLNGPIKNICLADARPATDDAAEFLRRIGLSDKIDRLSAARERVSGYAGSGPSLEYLSARQDLYEARQDLLISLSRINLELESLMATIEGEQNKFSEQLAALAARRDKDVWRTGLLTQWSNGILWCASSSFTIASPYCSKLSIPDGILGILAGFVPSALALYSMHQANGSRMLLPSAPNLLSDILSLREQQCKLFPPSVLAYMDSTVSGASERSSRREVLLNRWRTKKYIDVPGSTSLAVQTQYLAGTAEGKRALTILLLETRKQMLFDLLAEVVQMKKLLLDVVKMIER